MSPSVPSGCLIVNADDFGASHSVNQAVLRACREGVLRSASIMAGGAAFEEAAMLARELPEMSVGIHVTLVDGASVLGPSKIPGLVDERGFFPRSPAKAGIKYWVQRGRISGQIEAEIEAQFDRLQEAGIRPLHADSHHHLHVHPVIFRVLCRVAERRGVRWIRIPPGPLAADLRLAGPSGIPEWVVFKALAFANARVARSRGLLSPCTYGISRPGRVSTDYLVRLVSKIDAPVAEIFAHPDLDGAGRVELEALTSGEVSRSIYSRGFAVAGFKDICERYKIADTR
ncbi:MAG: ChbG/HpnK family deacetylase [Nitrospiraceae bacterium]|nr:ChbG/HpnK family deacetylase [Nitrospiraceae bacterium]